MEPNLRAPSFGLVDVSQLEALPRSVPFLSLDDVIEVSCFDRYPLIFFF